MPISKLAVFLDMVRNTTFIKDSHISHNFFTMHQNIPHCIGSMQVSGVNHKLRSVTSDFQATRICALRDHG